MKRLVQITAAILLLAPATASADQEILDDLIVRGSSCAGLDCSVNMEFDFDTMILSENNVRILFRDTSSSAGFPTTDWRLVANDTIDGGDNHFSIEDADTGRRPFTVKAGAPNYSVYVDVTGVGIGTNAPARALHLSVADTPTLRLQQTAAGGWTARTWDVGGNESTFFVRDATTGFLPLRIIPDAAEDTLIVAPGGVGVGHANPLAPLHVADAGDVVVFYEDTTPTSGILWQSTYGADWTLGEAGQAVAMTVSTTGNITIPGQVFPGSSRSFKKGIVRVDTGSVLAKVDGLEISRWRYRDDRSGGEHIGPMAEDFYAAFGVGPDDKHISPSDLAGVAVASTKALSRRVAEQDAQIARLEREAAAMRSRLERIEAMLNAR